MPVSNPNLDLTNHYKNINNLMMIQFQISHYIYERYTPFLLQKKKRINKCLCSTAQYSMRLEHDNNIQ